MNEGWSALHVMCFMPVYDFSSTSVAQLQLQDGVLCEQVSSNLPAATNKERWNSTFPALLLVCLQ